jgi:disulfide bond formation protein DsbB
MKLSTRLLNGLGFVAVVLLMATAYYMQYVMKLEPCPLCMLQRFIMMLLGLILLSATLHNPSPKGVRVYAIATTAIALAGLAAASRHVWLQHMPADQVPACAPSWDYLIDAFPLKEVVRTMFKGSGDCAQVTWTFLHLSIAEWMLIVFTGFVGLGIVQFVRRQER